MTVAIVLGFNFKVSKDYVFPKVLARLNRTSKNYFFFKGKKLIAEA